MSVWIIRWVANVDERRNDLLQRVQVCGRAVTSRRGDVTDDVVTADGILPAAGAEIPRLGSTGMTGC